MDRPENSLDPAAPVSAASAFTTENSSPPESNFVSKGERIHKWSTYLGIDWILNTTVGVSFAYWGKFTDLGKKLWSEPISKGFTNVLKPFIKDTEQLQKSVGHGNTFMSIIAGGMFTIPPLLLLESKKVRKSVITYLDGMIYGKDNIENDERLQKAHNEIQEAPKKDFITGLTSRFAALAPLLAMVLIPFTQKHSNRLWFDHVENVSELAANKLGFTAEKSFKTVSRLEAKERWKFIHKSIAMDFGLGIPYAILHAHFYNVFASKKDQKNKEKDIITSSVLPDVRISEPNAERKFTDRMEVSLPQASHVERQQQRQNDMDVIPQLGG